MATETLEHAFDLFRKLTKSDKEALELVKLFRNEVEEEVRRTVKQETAHYVNKEDLVREVSGAKEGLTREIATVKEEIAAVKEGLARVESNLTWKLFAFWIGQMAVMFGLLHYFLQK